MAEAAKVREKTTLPGATPVAAAAAGFAGTYVLAKVGTELHVVLYIDRAIAPVDVRFDPPRDVVLLDVPQGVSQGDMQRAVDTWTLAGIDGGGAPIPPVVVKRP